MKNVYIILAAITILFSVVSAVPTPATKTGVANVGTTDKVTISTGSTPLAPCVEEPCNHNK
ncbi:uncharacterized protein FA14DRAFT_162275 [Meira miltonrushii]|uniref:Uncharacterized protein n=1 Tax=Meira miltonrushii TaxID=1280837 RepID=A0A316V311_9BASI|nr:uncharacterized protein FA14DRAFT_162275 [Meira miltonrushii]PWN31949.1 hypothetical protein FA14DRAFT_162275 [Meira miltonrushii]